MNKFTQLRQAIEASGITPPDTFVADGCLHGFTANTQSPIESGYYYLIGEEVKVCLYGDTHRGIQEIWYSHNMDTLTPEQDAALCKHFENAKAMSIAGTLQSLNIQHQNATTVFSESTPATSHPYLKQKMVPSFKLRVLGESLVIPMRDINQQICGLQVIAPDGTSQFLFSSNSAGCYFSIGTLTDVLVVCTDYVTAASIHMATGWSTAAAFYPDNLQPAALALHKKCPNARMLIAADDEWQLIKNTGLIAAYEAAESIGAPCVIPKFGGNRPVGASSFNDMHRLHGLDAVRTQLMQVMEVQHAD